MHDVAQFAGRIAIESNRLPWRPKLKRRCVALSCLYRRVIELPATRKEYLWFHRTSEAVTETGGRAEDIDLVDKVYARARNIASRFVGMKGSDRDNVERFRRR